MTSLIALTDKNDGTTSWVDAERIVAITREPEHQHRPLSPGRPGTVDPAFTYVVLDTGFEATVLETQAEVIELMELALGPVE